MDLQTLLILAGGQGSGCNPRVGKCGRKPSALKKALAKYGDTSLFNKKDPDIDLLLKGGKFYPGESVFKECVSNECHYNAAKMWKKNPSRYKMMTGYALSKDKIWREHSWVRDTKTGKIIETTEPRTKYFGVEIPQGIEERWAKAQYRAFKERQALK